MANYGGYSERQLRPYVDRFAYQDSLRGDTRYRLNMPSNVLAPETIHNLERELSQRDSRPRRPRFTEQTRQEAFSSPFSMVKKTPLDGPTFTSAIATGAANVASESLRQGALNAEGQNRTNVAILTNRASDFTSNARIGNNQFIDVINRSYQQNRPASFL